MDSVTSIILSVFLIGWVSTAAWTWRRYAKQGASISRKVVWSALAGFLGACLVLIPALWLVKPTNSTATAEAAVIKNSSWDGSVRQVETYLKSNLNDPDSYQSVEWSKVANEGHRYFVRHKYRARNALGALVLEHKLFVLDAGGKVVMVTDYSD